MPLSKREAVQRWRRSLALVGALPPAPVDTEQAAALGLSLIEATWPIAANRINRALHEEAALPVRKRWREIALATGKLQDSRMRSRPSPASSSRVAVDACLALHDFEREAAAHADRKRIGPIEIKVVPLTALLIYKMLAARPRDIDDVRALLAIHGDFDADYVISRLKDFDRLLDADSATEFRRLVQGARPPQAPTVKRSRTKK